MSIFSKIKGITSAVSQYSTLATVAVAKVQDEVGSSNGDPAVQQTKKQAAIAYVLAAAHAGESVPIPQVQIIAMAVEMAANLAKVLGAGGKVPAPAGAVIAVPPIAV